MTSIWLKHKRWSAAAIVLLLSACVQIPSERVDAGSDDIIIRSCTSQATDDDRDTISDCDEGGFAVPPRDTDGDGVPDFRDVDSDNDGIIDKLEAGDDNILTPAVDTDKDGTPDFEDRDSDGDGLSDAAEDPNGNRLLDDCETDPRLEDTDNDGVSDLVEIEGCNARPAETQLACQCDAINPQENPRTRGDFVFVVDYEKDPIPARETFNLSTNINQADVIFMLDSTASMSPSLTNLAKGLAAFVPVIKSFLKNVAFGVVDFRDYPEAFCITNPSSCGSQAENYVLKYDHRIQTVATSAGVTSIQNALNQLKTGGGGDGPEAGWNALYAIAGGPSIDTPPYYTSKFNLADIAPRSPTAGEKQGTVGGAGFRAGAVPLIITVSDNEWHDAYGSMVEGDPESGLNAYVEVLKGTPSRRQAMDAVKSIDGHVIGLAATAATSEIPTTGPKVRAIATANETGAVLMPADFDTIGFRPAKCPAGQCCTGISGAGEPPDAAGLCPLSFSVNASNGTGVSEAIVSSIVNLSSALKFDIYARAGDVDDHTVERFIDRLEPNGSGTGPAAVCVKINSDVLLDRYTGPFGRAGADGVKDTFPKLRNGQTVCFDVVPKTNTSVRNTEEAQLFRARIQAYGDSNGARYTLGEPREVWFLVRPVFDDTIIQ